MKYYYSKKIISFSMSSAHIQTYAYKIYPYTELRREINKSKLIFQHSFRLKFIFIYIKLNVFITLL